MLKYNYILKDINGEPFSLVSDNSDIKEFLKHINGVYKKIAWIYQKNREKNTTKEYLIHQNNGFITEYALIYKNGKKMI